MLNSNFVLVGGQKIDCGHFIDSANKTIHLKIHIKPCQNQLMCIINSKEIIWELTVINGNIIIKNFNQSKLPKQILINGTTSTKFTKNSITVDKFPATIEIEY